MVTVKDFARYWSRRTLQHDAPSSRSLVTNGERSDHKLWAISLVPPTRRDRHSHNALSWICGSLQHIASTAREIDSRDRDHVARATRHFSYPSNLEVRDPV